MNKQNTTLMDEYQNACMAREAAIKELHAHLCLPVSNNALIDDLTGQMESAHEKAEELKSRLKKNINTLTLAAL